MNRTIILLLFLFLLMGGAAYYILNKDHSTSVASTFDTHLKLDDASEVYKIFIADRKGNRTTLTRDHDNWYLADGAKARTVAVNRILDVLTKMEYKYLMGAAESKNITARIAVSGIKVEIYDKADKNLLTFYVGPNSRDHEGTYMIREGSERPQIMNIPGFVGELRVRFDMKGDDWKDRTVLGYEPKNIRRIEVKYPKQKVRSFSLLQTDGKIEINAVDQFTTVQNGELNRSICEAYLDNYESKIAENYRNNMVGIDSIAQTIPFAIVEVEDIKGEQDKYTFFPLLTTETDEGGNPVPGSFKGKRYITIKEGGDVYLTQHLVFSPIFRSYESFFR